MVENRVLTNELLIQILNDNYNINETNIMVISGGSAELYNINNKYVVKLYQTKYSKEDIIKEINVINYLNKKDFLVPTLIKNNDNNYYYMYNDRCLVVQKFIEGKTYDKFQASKKMIKDCGYFHGLLVNELKDYETTDYQDVMEWCSKEKLEQAKDKLNKIILMGDDKVVINDLNDKIKMIDNFKYDFSYINNISYYVSHGDYSYLQLIYNKDNIKALIDFIRVKKLPIVWEIIRSYSYMDKKAKDSIIDIDNLILYVKEFMKNTKLTKEDLKLMPYIYLCQLLRSTYGYKEYYKSGNRELLEFGSYRTKLCKYLYENVDQISKELENI